MTLLNSPEYDAPREKRKRILLIGAGALILLTAVIGVGGFLLGHGWFFSNLPVEHRVSEFLTSLEAKDYVKAYGIWMNDPNWQQHPQKYDYTLTALHGGLDDGERLGSDQIAPCGHLKANRHRCHSSCARYDSPKKMFMWYEKSNGTLTYPAPYNLEY